MKTKTKKTVKLVITLVVILAIIIAVIAWPKPDAQGKFDSFTMETGTIKKVIVSSASVVAEDNSMAYSPVSGELKYEVKDGDIVKKDDVVAKIGAYTLKAQHNGEVMYILEDGDDATAGSPVYKLIDFAGMVMQANVSEMDINSVTVGQEVEITMTSSFEDKYTGTVTSINKEGVNMTGSTFYTVKTTIEGENTDKIFLGMTGDINIEVGSVDNVTSAELAKVSFNGKKAYVTLKDEAGEYYQKEIEVGFTDGVEIEVIGLPAGTVYYYEAEPAFDFNPMMMR